MVNSTKIITPSKSMAEMVKKRFPTLCNKNFQTIYHGFEKQTYASNLSKHLIDSLEFNGVKILYPTHPAPHKGFEILFKIIELLKGKSLNFKVFSTIERSDWPEVVEQYEKTIDKAGIRSHIKFIGRVPQAEMLDIYNHVDLVVYPSLCESFGFSMVEAMSCQIPMIVSGTSVNREICGDGALFYSPTDSVEGSKILQYAIENHEALRRKLKEHQANRIREFDWGWERYTSEFKGLFN